MHQQCNKASEDQDYCIGTRKGGGSEGELLDFDICIFIQRL